MLRNDLLNEESGCSSSAVRELQADPLSFVNKGLMLQSASQFAG